MHKSTEDLLKEAMSIIDEYLNAGCKDTRKNAHIKARRLYEEYYGVVYVNKRERRLNK